MTSAAHELVEELRHIHSTLSSLPSLAPGEQVNSLLTRLVNLCITPRGEDFASYVLSIRGVEALCLQLRPLCATAEGQLELYWAQRIIISSSHTQKLLSSFPYHQNYIDLSRLECCTLEAFLPVCSPDCRPSPCKIAFIGSGPLPLTSFCVLDRYPEAIVHNVDRDLQALRTSRSLAHRLGYGPRMSFSCEDVSVDASISIDPIAGIATSTAWKGFQVVFLAALVGMDTQTKMGILASLAKKLEPGTLVVARSAQGLRSVLYPILELSQELANVGYDILAEVHPWTKVVNSVIVLQVKG
ncbi:Nicotianamine synthase [Corynespora cassiicola Philippines]|uniref:Nicotianamine synthase n=1 Tax=Corynespora cassiicola Philippines TaxID=1448308 RepID=A0A2T2NHK0_CORCC|nr:Nicotianamine synthase [Corynespora cassiicola Philippines]